MISTKQGLIALFSIACTEATSVAAPLPASEIPDPIHLFQNINIFERDTRIVQSRHGDVGLHFAPIGISQTVGKVTEVLDGGNTVTGHVRGTTFLVSPCYGFTNYHTVFGDSDKPNDRDFAVTTAFSKEDDVHDYPLTNARPVVWGNYGMTRQLRDDWSLLKLDKCEGEELGWIEIGFTSPQKPPFVGLMSAGYPLDKPLSNLWVDPDCKITGELSFGDQTGGWINNCALRHAGSGSPILRHNEYSGWEAIGMQSWDLNTSQDKVIGFYDDSHANLAVETDEMGAALYFIMRDRNRYGKPNPAQNGRYIKYDLD